MARDGGPAFPGIEYFDEKPVGASAGMSLRDYLAAKVMQAELITAGALEQPAIALGEAARAKGQTIPQRIAFLAYAMADAMIAERDRDRSAADFDLPQLRGEERVDGNR